MVVSPTAPDPAGSTKAVALANAHLLLYSRHVDPLWSSSARLPVGVSTPSPPTPLLGCRGLSKHSQCSRSTPEGTSRPTAPDKPSLHSLATCIPSSRLPGAAWIQPRRHPPPAAMRRQTAKSSPCSRANCRSAHIRRSLPTGAVLGRSLVRFQRPRLQGGEHKRGPL